MTHNEKAENIVSQLEHGDDDHKKWLREKAVPLIAKALKQEFDWGRQVTGMIYVTDVIQDEKKKFLTLVNAVQTLISHHFAKYGYDNNGAITQAFNQNAKYLSDNFDLQTEYLEELKRLRDKL